MSATVELPNSELPDERTKGVVRQQIRGSGLLLAGRAISLGVTTLTQILIVRYLSTLDFGAWSYALSFVMIGQSLSNFGFHEAITRFVPIYHEHRDYPKMFGTIILSIVVLLLASALTIGSFYLWPHSVTALLHEPGPSLKVIFVLIFLVPLEALDQVLMCLFASLVGARAIFVRRYLVGPGLKMLCAMVMVACHASVIFLAFGYIASTGFGVAVFVWVLGRHLHTQGLLAHLRLDNICLPFKEIFSFTLPMMSSDLISLANTSVVVLLLGHFRGLTDVALYRVVLPAAALNQTIAVTSALIFLPAASRLFAANDHRGLEHLYWRTTTWLSVLSFPILAVTFAFARPLTVLLFGQRYAGAAVILSILAVGYYGDILFGFSGLTLKAVNKVKAVVICNVTTAAISLTLSVLLIPRYGAVGAAISTATALIAATIFRQIALYFVVGIHTYGRKTLLLYSQLAAGFAALILVHALVKVHFGIAVAVGLLVVVAVLSLAFRETKISEVFPECSRLPLVRRFFAS